MPQARPLRPQHSPVCWESLILVGPWDVPSVPHRLLPAQQPRGHRAGHRLQVRDAHAEVRHPPQTPPHGLPFPVTCAPFCFVFQRCKGPISG